MAGLATAPPLGSVAAPPPMCWLWWHWGSAQPQRWPSIRGTCGRRVTPSLETSQGEEKGKRKPACSDACGSSCGQCHLSSSTADCLNLAVQPP